MSHSNEQGTLYIISAPSGAGKTSLVAALLAQDAQVCVSVSHTTRKPREGEQNGLAYHFIDKPDFVTMIGRGEFLEHAEVFDHYYGTSQVWVDEQLHAGRDVILEIDWQGAAQVRQLRKDAVSIFIIPPSAGILRERLVGRGKDAAAVIEKRLHEAAEECSHAVSFDYLVVNDHFDTALADLQAIVRSQRLRIQPQAARHANVLADLIRDPPPVTG